MSGGVVGDGSPTGRSAAAINEAVSCPPLTRGEVGGLVWLVAAAGVGCLVGQCIHWPSDNTMLRLEQLDDLAVAA